MAVRPLSGVLRCLRRAVLAAEGNGPTDGELLELYRTGGDETAFELLLRKHGGMVWSVCRRVLGDVHDAEDAFQATFLVLVRKARAIRPAHMVGNWLHGVAYRTAMNAKANRARRQLGQTNLSDSEHLCRENDGELSRMLDEELERLPEKYRSVLVLCDLEGRTRKEAARQLGCPEGTVAGRLARARALLAKRLTRQGLALSAGALATGLSQAGTTAPASLIAATMKTSAIFALGASAGGIPANIVALSKGVLKTMLLDKLKVTGLVLTLVLAGLASTTIGIAPPRTAAAAQQPETVPAPAAPAETITPPLNQNRDRDPALQGVWSLQRTMRDGRTLPLKPGSVAVVITNRYLIWKEEDKDRAMIYKVRTDRNPKHIDLMSLEPGPEKGTRILGVYDVSGDTLVIRESDGLRPQTLDTGGSGTTMFIYTRVGGFGPSSGGNAHVGSISFIDSSGTWANKLFEAKGSTSHDFGKVPRGKEVTHRFYLKNIFSVPLDITDTRVSCGCVAVTKVLKSLHPGEETHVDVRLDTRRFSGPKTITIYVGMQGKEYASTARLQVKAESVEEGRAGAESSLRGQIVNVLSDKEQLVEINIGSDDGVNKQQRLQIFRLKPRAEYLGEMRILSVQPHRAVGRVVTPSRSPIIVGDEVGELSHGKQQANHTRAR